MIEWEPVAKQLGYETEKDMWVDLYSTKKLSIQQLAEKLDIGRNTVRDALERYEIPIRPRGGPNNRRLFLTDDILEKVKQNGVAATARELGVGYTTLYKRIFQAQRSPEE